MVLTRTRFLAGKRSIESEHKEGPVCSVFSREAQVSVSGFKWSESVAQKQKLNVCVVLKHRKGKSYMYIQNDTLIYQALSAWIGAASVADWFLNRPANRSAWEGGREKTSSTKTSNKNTKIYLKVCLAVWTIRSAVFSQFSRILHVSTWQLPYSNFDQVMHAHTHTHTYIHAPHRTHTRTHTHTYMHHTALTHMHIHHTALTHMHTHHTALTHMHHTALTHIHMHWTIQIIGQPFLLHVQTHLSSGKNVVLLSLYLKLLEAQEMGGNRWNPSNYRMNMDGDASQAFMWPWIITIPKAKLLSHLNGDLVWGSLPSSQ